MLAASWLLPVGLWALGRATTPEPSGTGTHEQLGLAACRFREHFGIPCPGCGVTTAVSHMAHGEPLAALSTQPLGFTLGLLALLLPLAASLRWLRDGDLARDAGRLFGPRLVIAAAALVLASWAFKVLST